MDNQFDINPHVIRQLGEELVPDEMTALMELIKNAYDADASYVKIDINTEGIYTEEQLTYPTHKGYIVVEDSGIGIPKEHQKRVFERFYRVDKSHSKEIGGTGLGLSIVKHGAQFHGAGVELESEPGKGTKVTLVFPIL